MASKINAESFYSQTIQSNLSTSDTSTNVDVAPAQDVGYAILELGESNQEMIKWGAKAGLTLSSLLRGLSLTALTDTEVAGNKKTHDINDSIQITDVHYIINDKVSNAAEEVIAGLKTFTLAPKSSIAAAATTELMRFGETCRLSSNQTVGGLKTFTILPQSSATPTAAADFTTKTYVDTRPAGRVSFDTKYAGETITDRNAISIESLDNTDGGSDGNFGRLTVAQGVNQAQSFIPGSTASSFSMTASIRKVASPTDNVFIEIQTDNSGAPSGTAVANGVSDDVSGAGLATSYADVAFTWSSDPTLVAGTKYWFVLKRDGTANDTNYYQAEYASNNAFRAGIALQFTTSWAANNDANDDLVFAISGVTEVAVISINTTPNSNRGRIGHFGFANAAAAQGAQFEIQTNGRMTGFSSLTPGVLQHVDTSAGGITATSSDPSVGFSENATTLIVARGAPVALVNASDAEALHNHASADPGKYWRTYYGTIDTWLEDNTGTGTQTPQNKVGLSQFTTGANTNDAEIALREVAGLYDDSGQLLAFDNIVTGNKVIYETTFKLNVATANEGRFGFSEGQGEGDADTSSVTQAKFLIDDGAGKVVTCDGTGAVSTATFTLSNSTNTHTYRIEWIAGTSVEFFVDNVSVKLVTSNIPLNTDTGTIVFFDGFKTTTTAAKDAFFQLDPYIAIQK